MGDVNANVLSKPLDNDAKHMKNIYIYDSNNLTQLKNEPTRTTDNTKTLCSCCYKQTISNFG